MLTPGDRIGPWVVVRALTATRHLCHDFEDPDTYAFVDLFRPRNRDAVLHAAPALGDLAHPALLPLCDVGEHEGSHTMYAASRGAAGRLLSEVIAAGPTDPETVRGWGSVLAEGLARAHGQGVRHRAICPDNIVITADGPKLFGFALEPPLTTTPLASAVAVEGDPAYAAPEAFQDEAHDRRAADVYALGQVLAEAIDGGPMFPPGADGQQHLAALINGKTSLRGLDPGKDVPAGIRSAILGATALAPKQRLDAGAFAAELAAAASAERPAPPPPDRGGWLGLAIALGAVGVVIIIAGAAVTGWLLGLQERALLAFAPVAEEEVDSGDADTGGTVAPADADPVNAGDVEPRPTATTVPGPAPSDADTGEPDVADADPEPPPPVPWTGPRGSLIPGVGVDGVVVGRSQLAHVVSLWSCATCTGDRLVIPRGNVYPPRCEMTVELVDGVVRSITARQGGCPGTPEGVTVGARPKDVKKTYGDPEGDPDEGAGYFVYRYPSRGLAFHFALVDGKRSAVSGIEIVPARRR